MPGGCLLKVFIYNNTISMKEETQAENVLYYWPAGIPLDEKLMDIGISGACDGFHKNFDQKSPIQSMCSDDYQFVWLEVETEFFVGAAARRQPDAAGFVDDYEEQGLIALLRQGYRLYRLHFGDMTRHFKATLDELRADLSRFWDVYAQWLTGPVSQGLDLFDRLDGIKYLPVDRSAYLKMQSVVNHIENEFPTIRATMVIIDNLLLYTGLNLEDTHTVYKFLIRRQRQGSKPHPMDNLLHLTQPNAASDDVFRGFLTQLTSEPKGSLRQLMSEKVLGKKSSLQHTPVEVHVGPFHENSAEGKPLTKLSLVVYQFNRILMAFFCDPAADSFGAEDPTANELFYKTLKVRVCDELSKASSITETIIRSIVWDENYQYVYFNRMNMAMKSSLKRKPGAEDNMRHVERLQQEFQETPG
eukprot:gene9453-14670_t